MHPIDLAGPSDLSAYVAATAAVCPFVEPAARAGCLFGGDVTPDCDAPGDLHPRLFELLVPAIERFRDDRRAVAEPHRRLLLSHTVVVRLPPPVDDAAVELLRWPNLLGWTLKHLYTPAAVVLGFVRRGVAERSRAGAAVPVAPFHAVVIRSRVAASDGRFFLGNPAMLAALRAADDAGQNVHAALFDDPPDVRDAAALRAADHYGRVVRWWRQSLAGRTGSVDGA